MLGRIAKVISIYMSINYGYTHFQFMIDLIGHKISAAPSTALLSFLLGW